MELEQLLATRFESESEKSGCFDCNICLETVNDPVVTLCGHLFCWPCIYKWTRFQSAETKPRPDPTCPVCKSELSEGSLVPLYGRGNAGPTKPTSASKPTNKAGLGLGIVVPRRPNFCSADSPRAHPSLSPYRGMSPRRESSGGIPASLMETTMGLYGEAVYARVFGDSITNLYTYPNSYNLAGNASPRVRRYVMEADRSLGRVCFFLSCCLVLCLLLF